VTCFAELAFAAVVFIALVIAAGILCIGVVFIRRFDLSVSLRFSVVLCTYIYK